MKPVQIETYRGHDIKIYVWRDALCHDDAFVGMYEVHPLKKLAQRSAVGGFVIAADAAAAALECAKLWIDEQEAVEIPHGRRERRLA